MANINCSSCAELRETAPSLIVNGFDDTMCASLKNDTGLNPSSGNDNCTDLNNMNDCLVGNMDSEIDAYEVCDWKEFMHKFIPNVWTTLKAMICSICGLWTNVHNLWKLASRIDCLVDYLYNGASFSFSEYSTDTKSYLVAGKGVSFLNISASGTASDINLTYIAGGLARLSGSCLFYSADFTDGASVYNFDTNAVNPRKTKERKGNSVWVGHDQKPGGAASELVYEIRLLKSEFPQIRSLFGGMLLNASGGGYHGNFAVINEGSYAYGQHGVCDLRTGNPTESGYDHGHLVPKGWVYVQCRITWVESLNATAKGVQYTPNGFLGIRMNQAAIDC